MYVMTLALGHRTCLYRVVHDAFGPLYGNALMDFAMYSVMERSNVAYWFKPAMEHEVIFSKGRKDDDWLSRCSTAGSQATCYSISGYSGSGSAQSAVSVKSESA